MSSKAQQTQDTESARLAPLARIDFPKPQPSDVLAGLSVALVVIPQSLAYAQIAGMPLYVGLFAAALPALVFSLFASSPYLQTGPVAMTSLLTFGALHAANYSTGDQDYVVAGALLAVMVGVVRLICGLVRFGWVAYLISDPVMIGFTSGAAVVIMASQFPKSVGASPFVPDLGTVAAALWTLRNPGAWSFTAVALALMTVFMMVGGRKLHRLFPGVLVAVFFGWAATRWFGYEGPTVGNPVPGEGRVGIPEGLPALTIDLPWSEVPALLVGAIVIAFVGFAEPSAIARVFANEDRTSWNASRELFSSGLANITSGISGGYPVGGSFSRSSVNRLAGARTRWSGGITGLVVLIFLGFASVLEDLPLAVLGGIVLAAVYRLIKPKELLALWSRDPKQALLAWLTFVATIAMTPDVQWAVVLGVALSVALHFGRRFDVVAEETGGTPKTSDRSTLLLKPVGLLWFMSQNNFARQLNELAVNSTADHVNVDLSAVVSLDLTTIETISSLAVDIAPRTVSVSGGPNGSDAKVADAISRALQEQAL